MDKKITMSRNILPRGVHFYVSWKALVYQALLERLERAMGYQAYLLWDVTSSYNRERQEESEREFQKESPRGYSLWRRLHEWENNNDNDLDDFDIVNQRGEYICGCPSSWASEDLLRPAPQYIHKYGMTIEVGFFHDGHPCYVELCES